ncbi:MAG: Bug family tripartite tricarboxylate transporter substrate binding protein [Burkholderiales bacterium]
MTIRQICCALVSGIIAASTWAQSFPDRPIRIVVPYVPGGSTDLLSRLLGEAASETLGQNVIVENRPGAGGMVGTAFVAKSAPDGHTIVICTVGTCAVNPTLIKNPGYDIFKDFAPVILIGGVMNVFVVNNSVPVKNIKELIALARAQPGKLTFGSCGIGNSPHMTLELLQYRTKVNIIHVPYKGSGAAITDALGGQIDMMVENEPSIQPYVKAGRLRGIAVTGAKRSPGLPAVPTMIEQGFSDFVVEPWFGFLAPAKTPRAAIDKLNAAFNGALKNPKLRPRLDEANLIIGGGTPEQLAAHMHTEFDKWAQVIKANNVKVD